jgi:hypothetical protein
MADKEPPHLDPGHWNRVPGAANEETFEFKPYRMEVVANEPDMSEVQRQLARARAQQELAGQYPGRAKNQGRKVSRNPLPSKMLPVLTYCRDWRRTSVTSGPLHLVTFPGVTRCIEARSLQ